MGADTDVRPRIHAPYRGGKDAMIINTVQNLIDALSELPPSTRDAQLRISDGVHCDTPILGVDYSLGIVAVLIDEPDCACTNDCPEDY